MAQETERQAGRGEGEKQARAAYRQRDRRHQAGPDEDAIPDGQPDRVPAEQPGPDPGQYATGDEERQPDATAVAQVAPQGPDDRVRHAGAEDPSAQPPDEVGPRDSGS